MDTTQLVLRVQSGDSQATDQLYYYSYKLAYTIALVITKNEQTAYELMQKSFVQAFSSIDTLRDKSKFIPWLNGILAGVIKEHLKDKSYSFFSALTMASDAEELSENTGIGFVPDKTSDYTEAKRMIAEILDDLPYDQELVFLMRYVAELSAAEIASSLETDETVIVSSLSEAVKRVKGQADIWCKSGAPVKISADQAVSFTVWMFRSAADGVDVHEMSPAVRFASEQNSSHTIAADYEEIPVSKNAVPENNRNVENNAPTPANAWAPAFDYQNGVQPEEVGQRPFDSSAPIAQSPDEYPPVSPESEPQFPSPVNDGFNSTAEDFEPGRKKNSKQTKKVIIIVSIAVVVMAALAFLFMWLVLPKITGEENVVSNMFSSQVKDENSPEDVVADFEKAFNDGDRDAMANCYLPDQSIRRNVSGGVIQGINSLLDLLHWDHGDVKFTLDSISFEKDDQESSDTATGKVKISFSVPILGEISYPQLMDATFEKQDHKWYFKEFLG